MDAGKKAKAFHSKQKNEASERKAQGECGCRRVLRLQVAAALAAGAFSILPMLPVEAIDHNPQAAVGFCLLQTPVADSYSFESTYGTRGWTACLIHR